MSSSPLLAGRGLTPRFLDGKTYEKLVIEAVKSVPELIQHNKALQE